jgi:hypothetical protein
VILPSYHLYIRATLVKQFILCPFHIYTFSRSLGRLEDTDIPYSRPLEIKTFIILESTSSTPRITLTQAPDDKPNSTNTPACPVGYQIKVEPKTHSEGFTKQAPLNHWEQCIPWLAPNQVDVNVNVSWDDNYGGVRVEGTVFVDWWESNGEDEEVKKESFEVVDDVIANGEGMKRELSLMKLEFAAGDKVGTIVEEDMNLGEGSGSTSRVSLEALATIEAEIEADAVIVSEATSEVDVSEVSDQIVTPTNEEDGTYFLLNFSQAHKPSS